MTKSLNYNLNKWLLLFLILYSADGISFFNSHIYPESLFLLFGISFYVFFRKNLRLSGFIVLMIPWIIYCFLSFIIFEAIRPIFFIMLPLSFFGTYCLFKSNYNLKNIFNSFENIIFILTKISLLFFLWQFLHKTSLISLFSLIDFNDGRSLNSIIYTIHYKFLIGENFQNSGFCWEPGPFSCFLNLSLLIHLLKTNFKLNRRFLIYVIAILTTFSSTGYLCLMIITFFIFYNKKFNVVYIPLVFLILITLFLRTDFLSSKIIEEYQSSKYDLEFYIQNNPEKRTSIGRFNGFLLNMKDFERYPILGFGGNFENTFTEENKLNITSTNGLGNHLAQYGIIGFFILLLSFYRSSIFIFNLYNVKGFIFLFLIFLTMNFSFNLIERPIFILFFFIYFIDKAIYKNTKSKNE